MQHVTVQIHTFSLLSIDCPQTKIVTWVYEIHKVCFMKWTSHQNTPNCLSTLGNVMWVHFIEVRPTKLISAQNVGLKNIIIIMKTQFINKI